ncbi:MAG: hypothetical protein V3W04_00785 [Gammaproteobacteria bacterium]
MAFTSLINDDWMDSYLMSGGAAAQAELTLKIKVYLARHPATRQSYKDADDQQVEVQTLDWDSASAHRWAVDLKNTIESGWSDKLWLIPRTDWQFNRPANPTHNYRVPCIACKLHIDYVSRSNAHVIINSYRINRDGFFRSGMQGPFSPAARQCSLNGCETIGTMDTNDIYPKASGQITALHEFGHFIGLSHVNAREARNTDIDTNHDLTYGSGDQARDLMGRGSDIANWHAYPWCRRLRRHLGGNQPSRTQASSIYWVRDRGPTPVWVTGVGSSEVVWQVSTLQRSHVVIDYLDLYLRRVDRNHIPTLSLRRGERISSGRNFI